ncbi:flagellar biosynthetic protein FliR [Iodobacter sp. HSC-16F04]|uniref:Flagellar biosynthetic protein FliR n=1 Tax=Iodobacter violaceini TaxID=3044271 RepID=A0ABX0KXR4_9NEIS|nr:flagellar biosynthetic protein FliR [Iodobacter violacea]NHQ85861.1 flagellar biosynthetic protein FliR [Iodobacter violacea]
MNDIWTVSQAQIDLWLAIFWWPFCRIFGFLLADPFYSSKAISVKVRVCVAIFISLIIAPVLPAMPQVPVVSPAGILIVINQLLIGIAIGYIVRIIFSAMEMAGHLAGLQMGLGFASFYDPLHATSVPIVAQFLSLMTILVFLALNGHLMVLHTLLDSFTSLPVRAEPISGLGFKLLVDYGALIFRAGVLLSLPVIGSLLVTNLAVGIMTRAAPQLNVFAVGFPLMMGIGLLAMYLSMPYMPAHIEMMLSDGSKFAARMMAAFAGK